MEKNVKKAIEIETFLANFNGEDGWKINNAWKLIIYKIILTE